MSIKLKILEEALVLFSDIGYEGTSMRRLAQSVGIKAASLYNHFDSKEAILRELVENNGPKFTLEMLRRLEQTGESPEFILRGFYEIVTDQWLKENNAKLMKIFMKLPSDHPVRKSLSTGVDELRALIVGYFSLWKKKGMLRHDFPEEYYFYTSHFTSSLSKE